MMKQTVTRKKWIKRAVIGVAVLLLVAFFFTKNLFFGGFNIDKTTYIYIDDRKDYNKLLTELEDSAHINGL